MPKKLQSVVAGMQELILEEINIKKVDFVDEDFVSYFAKPNFKNVGKKVGKQMKALQDFLQSADVAAIQSAFAKGEDFAVRLEEAEYRLDKDDLTLELQSLVGYQVESGGRFFCGAADGAVGRADCRGVCPRADQQDSVYAEKFWVSGDG